MDRAKLDTQTNDGTLLMWKSGLMMATSGWQGWSEGTDSQASWSLDLMEAVGVSVLYRDNLNLI